MARCVHVLTLVTLLSCKLAGAQGITGHWRLFQDNTTPAAICKDGPFIWVGTDAGVVRLDPTADTITIFDPSNSAVPASSIWHVIRDQAGAIWVASRSAGIACYKYGAWTAFTISNAGLPSNAIADIAADSLGRLWVATTKGLAKFDQGKWTTYDSTNSPFKSNQVSGVACDRTNNVWIGTGWPGSDSIPALFKFDGHSSWEAHSMLTDSAYYLYYDPCDMMVAKDSSLWIGEDGSIVRLKDRHFTSWDAQPIPANGGGAGNYVFGLVQDSIGGIWASDAYGIAYFDGTSWHARTRYGTSADQYYPFKRGRALMLDRSNLWASGYEAEGIAKLHDTSWTVFGNLSANALASNYPIAMARDTRGRYWFGDRFIRGFCLYDGSHWANCDSLVAGSVFSIAADSSGNIWIGEGGGFVMFDGKTAHQYDLNSIGGWSSVIYSVMYDKRRKCVWLGSGYQGSTSMRSGLLRLQEDHWKFYSNADQIQSLTMDTAGNIWMTSYENGVLEFDGDSTWHHFTSTNGLRGNYAFSVAGDTKGGVWAALNDDGAAYWDGAGWTSFSVPIPGLDACTIDVHGNVWMGGFPNMGVGGGVCVYDGKSWTAFTPQNSGVGSSMIWSAMADPDGNVWFGTNGQGLIEFIPDATSDVKQASQAQAFAFYPNPANASVTVGCEGADGTIQLFDMLGREVKRVNATAGKAYIETKDLVSGRYIISSNGTSMPIEIVH